MNKRFLFDEEYLKNFDFVIGTDEAGRGAGAGDVFAAAVCFTHFDDNLKQKLENINDSKLLKESEREELYEIITADSIWAINRGSIEDISRLNILITSLLAMKKCIEEITAELNSKKILVLIDGNQKIPLLECRQKTIIKGDFQSASIAAASIIAKVSRDRYMKELDKEYPMYGWAENKGYITKEHLDAAEKYGLVKYHRTGFFDRALNKSKQMSLFSNL